MRTSQARQGDFLLFLQRVASTKIIQQHLSSKQWISMFLSIAGFGAGSHIIHFLLWLLLHYIIDLTYTWEFLYRSPISDLVINHYTGTNTERMLTIICSLRAFHCYFFYARKQMCPAS